MRTYEQFVSEFNRVAKVVSVLSAQWGFDKQYSNANVQEYLTTVHITIPEATKMLKNPFGINCKLANATIKVVISGKNVNLIKTS